MSMSTHVVGFRPPNEKWKQMKAIWDACQEAGVAIPPDVGEFFGGERPDPAGVEVELGESVRIFRTHYQDGFEVDVTTLPKDVTVVRFYNSY